MIGSLEGKVIRIDGVTALIGVNGVGYEVDMSASDLAKIKVGENVFVFTQHIVREDAQILYGFLKVEQRLLFRTLIKVNGVGPKMALAVLSTFTVEDFVQTVVAGQSKSLEQIPGVGKKTAERMVVELKDSLKKYGSESENISVQNGQTTASSAVFDDAVAAMSALGYRENDAVKYVKAAMGQNRDMTTQQLIVAALALISKGRA